MQKCGKILRGRKDTLAPWLQHCGVERPRRSVASGARAGGSLRWQRNWKREKIRETRTFNAAEKESEVTQTDMTRLTSYSFFTPARQTRQRQDCFVVSDVAVWTGHNTTSIVCCTCWCSFAWAFVQRSFIPVSQQTTTQRHMFITVWSHIKLPPVSYKLIFYGVSLLQFL